MSRVRGRRPPKNMPEMNSAKAAKLTYEQVRALPLMSDVYVRMMDGRILKGKLVSHSDWLVGCPVVDVDGEGVGIGYRGEIIAAAPQQEVKPALEMGMARYGEAMQKLADGGD